MNKNLLIALGIGAKNKTKTVVQTTVEINAKLAQQTNDLNVLQYQELLNWLLESNRPVIIANIRTWRQLKGLPAKD